MRFFLDNSIQAAKKCWQILERLNKQFFLMAHCFSVHSTHEEEKKKTTYWIEVSGFSGSKGQYVPFSISRFMSSESN